MGGLKGQLDSIAPSRKRLQSDLAKFDKPTLVLPRDDDQIVPIGALRFRPSRSSNMPC